MSKTIAYYESKDDRELMYILDRKIESGACTREYAAHSYDKYSNHMYKNKYRK